LADIEPAELEVSIATFRKKVAVVSVSLTGVGGSLHTTVPAALSTSCALLAGRTLDQVLAFPMRAPASFTGEDVAEQHGHGGDARIVSRQLAKRISLSA
ncbi:MAG: hypothetical protein ACREBE_02300, partial [bacterium]